MKQSAAANLALVLAALASMALFFGFTFLAGDPRPGSLIEEIASKRNLALAIECGGYVLLLCSIWLSGYSFIVARGRSSLAMLACIAVLGIQIYFN
jgi:hypothetical protein